MISAAQAIGVLRDRGHRITKTRREIVDIFIKSKSPLTANQLLDKLKDSVNKTTVYRELDFLEEEGIINNLRLSLEEKYYEIDKDHHHHLICNSCGRIQKYNDCLIGGMEEIKNSYDFIVDDHSMEFYGFCKNCQ